MKRIVTPIFTLHEEEWDGASFYRLACPDWINIVPVTSDGLVVMVRQYRHGIGSETVEIPGGQMDPEDASPMEAARRELAEETGYGGGEWENLGWVHPNPAILDNRCHLFAARNVVRVGEIRNDEHEHTEVELVLAADLPRLIRDGTITHGLVLNALFYYGVTCGEA